MNSHQKAIAVICGSTLAAGALATTLSGSSAAAERPAPAAHQDGGAPEATVRGVAKAFGISPRAARTELMQQDQAH
ncbi:hypothetical protein, partial [Luteipulveratus mongoliensis]